MSKKIILILKKFLLSDKGTGDSLVILGMCIYGVNKGRKSLARVARRRHAGHLALVYPMAGGAEGREGEHANKLALYLKQLLGIAVTHTDEDRGLYCRAETKRPRVRRTRS